ncbi:acyltransferase family protein [Aquabacter spiritensis]|uniref:Peptidoglycan/LPS O-acetylase OafA/YrhL n=1 Tax=Aquabacter spiritensis TaxID=933073 RepID=A0A4V2UY42_9HYPH|nr:acyltransferase [Aquabacter spiritensis]TCT05938.1 peptidoglycan/LPS O-acetylase OafA/YrhL [Aquabacter spiritensis]
MIKDYGDTTFITGLRALAAIAVILLHAGGAGLRDWGVAGDNFVEMAGRGGVYVFFVISGFSVSASYLEAKDYRRYLARRFWRIAPPYYFWLALVGLGLVPPAHWVEVFKVPVDAYNLVMHFTFLSFLDYRIADALIGVEWSLPVEMVYYLLVPLVLVRVRSWGAIALLIGVGYGLYRLGLSNLGLIPVRPGYEGLAYMWSPLPYVLCFALGIAAFRIREKWAAPGWLGDAALVAAALAVPLVAAWPGIVIGALKAELLLFSALAFALVTLGSRRSRLMNLLLVNRPIQYLGLISYSLYLAHMPVLGLAADRMPQNLPLRFLVTLVLTVAVSALTYRLVEVPGQRLGRWLGARRRAGQPESGPATP